MKLKPLEQWICDKCGQVIESADQGWLEWLVDDNRFAYDFKIVHHYKYSPIKDDGRCYFHHKKLGLHDVHLHSHIGDNLVSWMLKFLDVGPYHDNSYSGPWVKDIREYVEIFRRLGIPYYEEAILYWSKAESDGYFSGANEYVLYLPDSLKELIELYGD